jgi:hypothetical protein
MARWQDVADTAPEFAKRFLERLDAHTHKTVATLRKDGSPRISGIECWETEGDLWFGSMARAVKAMDLQRDPRYALHSGSDDPDSWGGDAKLSGRAEEITDSERKRVGFRSTDPVTGDSHLFRLEIEEAVLIGLNEERTRMVIELWRPDGTVRRTERE